MAQAPQQQGGFVVRPFAVMKLTHDAIRYRLDLFEEIVNKGADKLDGPGLAALNDNFSKLHACITLHARQENDVFFPKLRELVAKLNKDEKTKQCFVNPKDNDNTHNNEAKQNENEKAASFFAQHDVDDDERAAVLDAFKAKDKAKVLDALKTWMKDHREHLKVCTVVVYVCGCDFWFWFAIGIS